MYATNGFLEKNSPNNRMEKQMTNIGHLSRIKETSSIPWFFFHFYKENNYFFLIGCT